MAKIPEIVEDENKDLKSKDSKTRRQCNVTRRKWSVIDIGGTGSALLGYIQDPGPQM